MEGNGLNLHSTLKPSFHQGAQIHSRPQYSIFFTHRGVHFKIHWSFMVLNNMFLKYMLICNDCLCSEIATCKTTHAVCTFGLFQLIQNEVRHGSQGQQPY